MFQKFYVNYANFNLIFKKETKKINLENFKQLKMLIGNS